MIRQMFKIIWNRRRNNFLMITGLVVSFIVLFLAVVTISYNVHNYLKPLGFSPENVWKISMNWKRMPADEVRVKLEQMELVLQASPEIESFAFSRSLLFVPASSSSETFKYDGRQFSCDLVSGGDKYPQVLNFDLLAGRWFDAIDKTANRMPVVLNKYAADAFFPKGDALGKIIYTERPKEGSTTEYKVIGIIEDFRYGGDFTKSEKIVCLRQSLDDERYANLLESRSPFQRILIRVKAGATAQFEEKLIKELSSAARGISLSIERLEEARRFANRASMTLPLILTIICAFLVFNVALGLFGLTWYRTNQRRPEIGLRRAAGANIRQIFFQVLGETIALSSFAIIIASFIALQFPMLDLISFIDNQIYYISFVITVLVIYLITGICAVYPGLVAAKIQPATALHYE